MVREPDQNLFVRFGVQARDRRMARTTYPNGKAIRCEGRRVDLDVHYRMSKVCVQVVIKGRSDRVTVQVKGAHRRVEQPTG